MPSIFQLFGEIDLKTDRAEAGMKRVSGLLHGTQRDMAATEKLAKTLGERVNAAVPGFTKLQLGAKGATSELGNVAAQLATTRFSGLTNEVSAAGGALSSFAGPVGLAAGGIAILGTTAVATATALFDLANRSSEFGSKIHDLGQQTGLSTEAISTLKFNADNAGSSIDQIASSIGRFSKTVGDAANGSDKAAAKLRDLGIEPQAALRNLDGALDTVFKRIHDAKPGIDQITLAQEAFGKSGAELIPVIEQMNGSFADAKTEAQKLGLTLSQDAADAADEFGDKMGLAKAQVEAMETRFGIAVGKTFLPAIERLSDSLSKNQEQWNKWSETAANAVGWVANRITTDLERIGPELQSLAAIARGDYIGAVSALTTQAAVEFYRDQQDKYSGSRNGLILDPSTNTLIPDPSLNKKARTFGLPDDDDDSAISKTVKKLADASSKAKEYAEAVKRANQTVLDVYSSTTDNPFIKNAIQMAEALQRVRLQADILGSSLTRNLETMIKSKFAANDFGLQLANRVQSALLRADAKEFLTGEKLSVSDRLKELLKGAGGGKAYRQAVHVTPQLNAMSNAALEQMGITPIRGRAGDLVAAYKWNVLGGAAKDAAQQHAIDQQIIALTSGLNPSDLDKGQREMAAGARIREAAFLDTQKQDEAKWRTDVLEQLRRIGQGNFSTVRILDDSNGRAKITRRPTAADVAARYGGYYD